MYSIEYMYVFLLLFICGVVCSQREILSWIDFQGTVRGLGD